MHSPLNLDTISVILWDFDGVILDSVPIRDEGYRQVLKEYPKKQVGRLLDFQKRNGGLSRYVKFRYFFEEILESEITTEQVQTLAAEYSSIMLEHLLNPNLLIEETMNVIRTHHRDIQMHIISGSDQEELRTICRELQISHYFASIQGSPASKVELVKDLLQTLRYASNRIVFIGDSINDFEAAKENGIRFFGYNNPALIHLGEKYLHSL